MRAKSQLQRLRIFLKFAAAVIVYHNDILPRSHDESHAVGRVDAFRGAVVSPTLCRNNEAFPSRSRNIHEERRRSRLKQQQSSPSSSSETSGRSRPRESQFPQRKRRRNDGGRSDIAFRSRAHLSAFEDMCQRETRRDSLRGKDFADSIDSMVRDLLEGKNILEDGQAGDEGEGKPRNRNLSHDILPRDASSLIRLLGRKGAHDAMLEFCRRYCRDIVDRSEASKHNTAGDKLISRSDAEEAVLFAYTASIAACSKPPPTSLASSKESMDSNYPKYRSKSCLLSLLNEMEHDYTESGRSIRPNSYTLSAVLLGIDDVEESLGVLEEFEARYRKHEDDVEGEHPEHIVTVQVYNVVIASCSNASDKNRIGWQRALSILQRMRRLGPEPNEQTYSMILQACAEHGQMKVATSLLEETRQSPVIAPTAKLYIPLLKVCAKFGHDKMSSSLIDVMKEDSLELSTEVMNVYLSALAKSKLHVRALRVLRDMIVDPSTPPDIVTFNTCLAACANAGDNKRAQDLLDEMKNGLFEFPGVKGNNKLVEIKPDVVSYNTVISCADPETALFLIQEMKLTRRNRVGVIKPNSVSYVNAISQCRKASIEGDPRSAYEIATHLLDLAREEDRGKGIDLNVFVYSASIWMAEAVHDYQTAVRLLREMKCSPNNICYDGVISALSHHGGFHREALYYYYEMQQLGLSASRKTYQRLAFAIDNSRDTGLSITSQKKVKLLNGVLSVMPGNDRRIQIGGPIFEMLIRNHGNTTDPDTSYRAARMVFDSIIGPVDDKCLTAMLSVCYSTVKWKEALTLLHSSDIVNKPSGPGLVSNRALGYAVLACTKADQWKEALIIIDLYGAEQMPFNKKSGAVSIAAINSVIRACGRSSRPDMAVQVLNDMPVKYGVQPDEISYRLAIIACNQAEHRELRFKDSMVGFDLKWWECSLSLLRRMKEEEIQPSLQTYSSVVSACEAAGQWQRAIGVLRLMPSFSSLLGSDEVEEMDASEPANLYCLNAAISACEKGGAWIEALQLYESVCSVKNTKHSVRPNFITVNSILIALEKANQLELAESIYSDAIRKRIVSPWKRRCDNDGELRRMMDLHHFSAPMAKVAVRSYLSSLLTSRNKFNNTDAVLIVGKGKRSEERPVLMPAILQLLRDEYEIDATVDKENTGRIRVAKESIERFIRKKKWRV